MTYQHVVDKKMNDRLLDCNYIVKNNKPYNGY
jgi:hypothetical protein